MKDYNKVIFELSSEGRKGYRLPNLDIPEVELQNYYLKTY